MSAVLRVRLLEDVPLEMIESHIGETVEVAPEPMLASDVEHERPKATIVGAERIDGDPHVLLEPAGPFSEAVISRLRAISLPEGE